MATPAAKSRTAAKKEKVALDDLSPADRERLLAEAREGENGGSSEADGQRLERMKALLNERDHREGCPVNRVEVYADRTPAKPQNAEPAKDVTVAHCIDCGATRVLDEPIGAVNRRLDGDQSIEE